jgi:predicted metal-binding protein
MEELPEKHTQVKKRVDAIHLATGMYHRKPEIVFAISRVQTKVSFPSIGD